LLNTLGEEIRDWWQALIGCIPGRTGRLVRRLYYRNVLSACGPVLSIGENVEIGCPAHISLGNETYLVRGSVLRACGNATLQIGDRFALNGNARVIADFGSIEIGTGVMVGPNVVIRASNHQTGETDVPIWGQGQTGGHVVIGDDVWIGANVVIVSGARIGAHCVIAAGAVVTGEIPDHSVAGGIPARVIQDRLKPSSA
jgi:galactoside O-acetyltransferase